MKHFIILFLMSLSLTLFSQKKVWVKFGDQAMNENDAYSAAKFYELALEGDTSDYKLLFKYGTALASYQNYKKALPIFVRLKVSAPEEFPLLDYQIANIYKSMGKYLEANDYFKKFMAGYAVKTDFEYLRAKNEVANFDKVQLLLKDTANVKILSLPGEINTGAAEFAPFLLNDSTLVFSSLRAKKIEENGIVLDSNYLSKLYLAVKKDSIWKIEQGKYNIEIDKKSIANISYNKNKSEVYFSVCQPLNSCKIYSAKTENGQLNDVQPLPENINEPESNTTHPLLIEKEGKKYLFFSSNRTGGKGGMDLWVSEFQNQWLAPKNLGKSINSLGNEITPFYDYEKDELYFSSDWHYNLGGYDVFKAKGTFPSSYSNPSNLGLPYNSSLNDLYYLHKDSLHGFITSSREGSITEKDAVCCNDIFEFKKPVITPENKTIDSTLTESKDEILLTTNNTTDAFKFPLTVYFHNDIPNPRSRDTNTILNYESTFLDYRQLKIEYINKFSEPYQNDLKIKAQTEVDSFFNFYAEKGYQDLLYFAKKLNQELQSGKSVEVYLKGFASPLTKSDYNVNLSKRRIQSIVNYLSEYQNGILLPYILGTADNKAKLTFIRNPNGEYKAKKGVSHNYYDVRNSIYNPKAALERRVEVEARFMEMGKN